jgi:hypothetical protein
MVWQHLFHHVFINATRIKHPVLILALPSIMPSVASSVVPSMDVEAACKHLCAAAAEIPEMHSTEHKPGNNFGQIGLGLKVPISVALPVR